MRACARVYVYMGHHIMSDFKYKVSVLAFVETDGDWEEVEQDIVIPWDQLPITLETIAANQRSTKYQLRQLKIDELDE